MNSNTRNESTTAIHTSLSNNPDDENITSFDNNVHFGLDSCSTNHACNGISLFLKDTITEVMDSGILGVGGVANVAKKGTIRFKIIDSYGKESIIDLENVFWVENCPRNVISIDQWGEEKDDDATLLCKSRHSMLAWDNDEHGKMIYHPHHCRMPLMGVSVLNKRSCKECHATQHASFLIDNRSPASWTEEVLKDEMQKEQLSLLNSENISKDQQSNFDIQSKFRLGQAIHWKIKDETKTARTTSQPKIVRDEIVFVIQILNSDSTFTARQKALELLEKTQLLFYLLS